MHSKPRSIIEIFLFALKLYTFLGIVICSVSVQKYSLLTEAQTWLGFFCQHNCNAQMHHPWSDFTIWNELLRYVIYLPCSFVNFLMKHLLSCRRKNFLKVASTWLTEWVEFFLNVFYWIYWIQAKLRQNPKSRSGMVTRITLYRTIDTFSGVVVKKEIALTTSG